LPDTRRLRGWIAGLLLLAALTSPAWAEFDDAGYEEAISTILCDCGCHPQSVKACACGRAAEMRQEMHDLVAGGMTGEQVIDRYVETHGELIRIAPTADGFNLVAWLGPFVALFVGTLTMWLILRGWQRRHPTHAAEEPAVALPTNDPYLRRLRRELEELE